MQFFPEHGKNKYKEKYANDVPVYPSKKDISIRRTNNFYEPFCLKYYENRISKLQEFTKHLPFIPFELWSIVLLFQMYLEDNDAMNHHSWLYSDYSLVLKHGMKLRTRQIYLPNICGIVMNEGFRFINFGQRAFVQRGYKKKNND